MTDLEEEREAVPATAPWSRGRRRGSGFYTLVFFKLEPVFLEEENPCEP